MTIFKENDFREIIRERTSKSYGALSKLAKAIGVHSSYLSQVMSGNKDFTFDQACAVSEFFNMGTLESDYFITLVLKARAATPLARHRCNNRLEEIRELSRNLEKRVEKDRVLSSSDAAIFYSEWQYIATQLAASIPNEDLYKIGEDLGISKRHLDKIIQFLTSCGMITNQNGILKTGSAKTHIGSDSPFATRHHWNWRTRANELRSKMDYNDKFITLPVSVSKKDIQTISELIDRFVDQAISIIDDSKPETIACLNLDWFTLK